MLEIKTTGYNNFNLAVSLTVSSKTEVGTGKTLKQLISILKSGGNVKFNGTVGGTKVEIPNVLGMNGTDLVLAGITDESGTATVYTGEFEMGTGANKDKLYLTVHADTV